MAPRIKLPARSAPSSGLVSSPKTQVYFSRSAASTITSNLQSKIRSLGLKEKEQRSTFSKCEETDSDTDSLSSSIKQANAFRNMQLPRDWMPQKKQSFIVDSQHEKVHMECHIAVPSGDIRKVLNGEIMEPARQSSRLRHGDVYPQQRKTKFQSRDSAQDDLGTKRTASEKISLLSGVVHGRTACDSLASPDSRKQFPYNVYVIKMQPAKLEHEAWEEEMWYDEFGRAWTEAVAGAHAERLKREQLEIKC